MQPVRATVVLSFLFAALTTFADDLTFLEHQSTIVNGQISNTLTTNVATLPFNITATGERYTGNVEVTFPQTISGKPDASGQFFVFDAPVKTTVKMTFTYTTRTGDPKDTTYGNKYEIYTADTDGPSGSDLTKCINGTQGEVPRVNPGVYNLTYTTDCTWSKAKYCATCNQKVNFNSSFIFTTFNNGGIGGFWIVVRTRYGVGPDLQITVVDPNCASPSDVDCNGAVLDSLNANVSSNTAALRDASAVRTGVAADGVTLLLLRAKVPEAKATSPNATFTLIGSKAGTLMKRDGSGAGNSVDAPFELTSNGNKYAFAVYRAPLDHPAPSALFSTSFTIEARQSGSSAAPTQASLRLVPPPVILVHGVWSDSSAWAFLSRHLRTLGYTMCTGCLPDYGRINPAPEFNPLSRDSKFVIDVVRKGINAALRDARRRGIAATQVDGVGHSMGGIVLRARVAYDLEPYKDLRNYFQGDLHKIISVGSPHQGSSLVTWLIDHRCDAFTGLAKASGRETIQREFEKMGRPLGPAVYGFQVASVPLQNLGKTNVPGHAIIGIEPATSVTEQTLNDIFQWTNNTTVTIDNVMGGAATHDTIVPTTSQSASIGIAATRINGVVHASLAPVDDIGETESQPVFDRVAELLKSSIANSSDFAPFQPYTAPAGQAVRVPAPCPAGLTLPVETNATVTVTPAAGTVVKPGDTVVLSMSISGGNAVEGASFAAGNRYLRVTGAGPAFTASYVVPSDRAGRIDVVARTFGKTGNNFTGSTFINVQLAQPPASIQLAPDQLAFTSLGEKLQVVVIGTLANGSEIDLTSSTAGTTYKTGSGKTTVIAVNAEGMVEAKGSGSDTVIVTSGGKTATINATVVAAPPRRHAARR